MSNPCQMNNHPMRTHKPVYTILLHRKAWGKLITYQEHLISGGSAGANFSEQLSDKNLSNIPNESFLEALIRTKRPQVFAESAVSGDGTDWNPRELSILGDISIGLPVQIYDNGRHNSPKVHQEPFQANLIFTPGALLKNGRGQTPADWDEVIKERELDPAAYTRLYERRLLPALKYAVETAKQKGVEAFITIPGLGCGQFAGIFHHQLGPFLKDAIRTILETHGPELPDLKAVYYDPYRECENERHKFHGIDFLVRPLKQGNENKSQLCRPESYQEPGDDFSGCELTSIVAWDHVSWPGNDFYLGSRSTDDGVKAAATDSMYCITGIQGRYHPTSNKYQPPNGFRNWNAVIREKGLELRVINNIITYP